MNKSALIKRIARSVIEGQRHSRLGKNDLRKVVLARIHKKKIPDVKPPKEHHKDPEFAKLSIEEYEKKYPSFEK